MFQSFFNSLSGLFSFSKSLNTISNNVSNMNTPGFRGSDSFFRSVNSNTTGAGLGTQVQGNLLRHQPGEMRQTENPSDLALNGAGFFILRNDQGETFYTRAGQFRFDKDGFLIDSATEMRVAGTNDAGNLIDINIDGLRTLPPQATSTVTLAGNLSPSAGAHTISDINVFNASGDNVVLTAVLTDNSATTPNSWTVDVTDADGNVIGSGELRFAADGSPQAGFNTIDVTLTSGGQSQNITLDFGTPGSFSGATNFSGSTSNLGVRDVDGHSLAGLSTFKFDDDGVLHLTYTNGEKAEGPRLALAHFKDESVLQQAAGSAYTTNDIRTRTIGSAGQGLFGTVEGGSLELSNVDLTKEFADMMIIQRGYQASSRVMNVANELIERLYNNSGR